MSCSGFRCILCAQLIVASLFFFSFTNPEDRRGGTSLYTYGMQQRHRLLLLLFILSNCCLGSQCCHMLREVLNVKGVCFFRSFLTLLLHDDRQKLLVSSFQDVVCAVCVFIFILFCRFNSFFLFFFLVIFKTCLCFQPKTTITQNNFLIPVRQQGVKIGKKERRLHSPRSSYNR